MSYAAENRKVLTYSPILTNAALRRLAQPDADKRRQDLQRQLKSDSGNVEAADFVGVTYGTYILNYTTSENIVLILATILVQGKTEFLIQLHSGIPFLLQ